ncbi:MAG: hypothetical protein JWL83_2610 [Actinomycetia bacterium]|jgi:anti-anti-sigma factor|nr:hypothetical protein [Actinomycetes bacterium]
MEEPDVALGLDAARDTQWRPWHHVDADLWMCSSYIGRRGLAALRGDIDENSARALGRELDDLRHDGVSCLVLDLEHVRRVDAAGARILERIAAWLEAANGALLLRRPSYHVRKALQIPGPRARVRCDAHNRALI